MRAFLALGREELGCNTGHAPWPALVCGGASAAGWGGRWHSTGRVNQKQSIREELSRGKSVLWWFKILLDVGGTQTVALAASSDLIYLQ